jgi:hypothetical protein
MLAIRSMVHIRCINALKSTYYANYFHSILKYATVFWGNSSISGKLTLKKKTVIITAGSQPRTSGGSQLEILPIHSQYILSLISSTTNNQEMFQIHLYTISIQGISIILIAQMPTYFFKKKKRILCWHKNFQNCTT